MGGHVAPVSGFGTAADLSYSVRDEREEPLLLVEDVLANHRAVDPDG